MKLLIQLLLVIIPFYINSQIISKIEFRMNGYYSFVKQNYKYLINEYNTVYAYHRLKNSVDTIPFLEDRPIYGIVDPHPYLAFEPEISIRKSFFKKKLELGLKLGIKQTRISHDYVMNVLGSSILTISLSKVDQKIYYGAVGLQIAYYSAKFKSRIELGIENSLPLKRIESSTRLIYNISSAYIFVHEASRNFKHGGGLWCYTINYNYFLKPYLFVGVNFKYREGGDAVERFKLFEHFNNDKVTHLGSYTNGLRFLGVNIGYSYNF